MPSTPLGSSLGFFDRSSAWLAGDHILIASRMLWVEQYNRFYFSDIQAIAICRTVTGVVWNILLGTGLGLVTLVGMLNGFSPMLTAWIGLLAVPLLGNTLSGPTCSCHIYTAVSNQKLSCFNRLGKAEAFLSTVRPLIAEAQGEVSEEELVERTPLVSPVRRLARGDAMPDKAHHYGGGVHKVLFVILGLGAAASVLLLITSEDITGWLVAILFLAQLGTSIAAAARQAGSDIPPGVRTVVWLAFAQVFIMAVLYITAAIVATEEMNRYGYYYDQVDPGPSTSTIMFFSFSLLSACFSLILCLAGRHMLSVFGENHRFKRMAHTIQTQTFDQ